MSELAQVKATIPKDLKRQAFATFALQDEKFNRWLERHLRAYVRESGVWDHDQDKQRQKETVLGVG